MALRCARLPWILLVALMLACTACMQEPPPDPARRATIPPPDAAPTAPSTSTHDEAGPASPYACDDGNTLRVAYIAETARVEWPDGRMERLPKAQSASNGGGEVFVGDASSLQRDGNGFQLHRGEGPPLSCHASGDPE